MVISKIFTSPNRKSEHFVFGNDFIFQHKTKW